MTGRARRCFLSGVFAVWMMNLSVVSGEIVDGKWKRDSSLDNFVPTAGSLTSWFPVTSRTGCAVGCKRYPACLAFYHNAKEGKCILYPLFDATRIQTESSPGSVFYKLQLDPCPPEEGYIKQPATDTCYQINTDVTLTWFQSRDKCADQNGRLAVLDRAEKADFIIEYTRQHFSGQDFWIGAHRPYSSFNTPFPSSGPDYVWLSGQALDMVTLQPFFGSRQPDNNRDKENTLMVMGSRGHVLNDMIDNTLAFYICEKPSI